MTDIMRDLKDDILECIWHMYCSTGLEEMVKDSEIPYPESLDFDPFKEDGKVKLTAYNVEIEALWSKENREWMIHGRFN